MKASISGTDSLVLFRNSQGLEGRGTLLHLTRNQAVFEVYNPYSIVQLSEVLADLRILRGERTIYSGRAVASHLLPTGIMVIVSATLVDAWSDLAGLETTEGIRDEVAGFVRNWEDTYALRPSFQLAVSTLRSFLGELSRWLGQVEAVSGPGNAAPDLRREFTQEVEKPLVPKLAELFCRFEDEAAAVPPAEVDAHKGFARREIHPLLLCSPFVHRTYTKPLGYAGDYEMVNMLLADPLQGSTTYARIVNAIAIRSPTGQGHRNRIAILLDRLRGEAARVEAAGQAPLRVLNVGCGPAREVEDFLLTDPLANRCQLRLMDFNDETIRYTEARLRQAAPSAEVEMVHRSIHDLLKDASRRREATAPQYDLVYCAGLFDYLGDRVCRQLVRLFWEWTVPGGLVLTTNVHRSNPIRQFMEYLLEWYLVYRDEAGMESLAPPDAPRRVYTDPTGVNVFLELRKGGAHP